MGKRSPPLAQCLVVPSEGSGEQGKGLELSLPLLGAPGQAQPHFVSCRDGRVQNTLRTSKSSLHWSGHPGKQAVAGWQLQWALVFLPQGSPSVRASAWPGTSALEECFGKPTAMETALCAEGRACGSGTATPARALLAGGRHSTKAPGAGRGTRPAGPAPAAHGSCPSGRGCTAEAPAGGNYRPAGKLWQCLEARGPWRHPPGSGKQGPLRAETPSWAQVPRHRA